MTRINFFLPIAEWNFVLVFVLQHWDAPVWKLERDRESLQGFVLHMPISKFLWSLIDGRTDCIKFALLHHQPANHQSESNWIVKFCTIFLAHIIPLEKNIMVCVHAIILYLQRFCHQGFAHVSDFTAPREMRYILEKTS